MLPGKLIWTTIVATVIFAAVTLRLRRIGVMFDA